MTSSIDSVSFDATDRVSTETDDFPLWEKIGKTTDAVFFFPAILTFFFSGSPKKRSIKQIILPHGPFILPEFTVEMDSIPAKKISYAQLPCSALEKEKIRTIVTTVAKGGINLLWERKKLNQIGDEIRHVHPFKFLSTIFVDPELKERMRDIFNDTIILKKNEMIAGVKEGMVREAANLSVYMEDFAREVGTTSCAIQSMVQAHDAKNLMEHLLVKHK